ncbi:MAG TPA: formate dehydrogenase accessory sulfurtransferase FdhD [Ensifer sp.]|nr:formate dehydrogenase accessory sulfurtransferase FdhD [Ensifer sp.]
MNPSRPLPRLAFASGRLAKSTREIAEEVPVAFTYRGSTQAVMMASPADLEDFAHGFTLNEGIVTQPENILSVIAEETGGGIDLQIELAGDHQAALTARRRAMAGPVGCGLCGIESIEQALLPARKVETAFTLSPESIADATASLSTHQPLFAATRAVHAAGFYRPGEGLLLVREDVGRHNALDKLCGAMARSGIDGASGAIVLTSRVSVEMVQKTAMSGAGVLIAISAPTALAIRMAEAAGITLVALARDRDFEIFTHTARVAAQTAPERDADVA